jgi:hypothetical protein
MSLIPIPSILDRSKGYMTLQFRNTPDILGYRIRVSNSLNNAYGPFNGVPGDPAGAEGIFDVQRGQCLRTKQIRIKKLGVMGDITRGQTRATFDPNEFFNPPTTTTVPPDSQLIFMRVQIRTTASPTFPGGAFPGTFTAANQSDILVVQTPDFFSAPSPALTLYGTAPGLATAVLGLPAPPESMVIHVPASGWDVVVINHDLVNPLYLSLGNGLPLIQVDPATSIYPSGGVGDTISLCAAVGTNPNFSLLVNSITGTGN